MQAREFHVRWHIICQISRWRAGAHAVGKAVAVIEFDRVHQLQKLSKIVLSFAWKTDDKITRDGYVWPHAAQRSHCAFELQRGVAALHRREHPITAVLHW